MNRTIRQVAIVVCCYAVIGMQSVAIAKPSWPDTRRIPLERIISNLENQIKTNPNDLEPQLALARAYSFAYAMKSDTLLSSEYNSRPSRTMPANVRKASSRRSQREARIYLGKAISIYKKILKAAPANIISQLGYAWCTDQVGNNDKAIELYRKIIRIAWSNEKKLTRLGIDNQSLSVEASSYLIDLLDPNTDAAEIRKLREQIMQINNLPRPVSPIVIALNNNCSFTSCIDNSVSVPFDLDSSNLSQQWHWSTPEAGWLVYDADSSGQIFSALQLFGNVTFWMFWENGYKALRALDDDANGILEGRELICLSVWRDINQNGRSEQGEVFPLSYWDITAISCAYKVNSENVPYNNEGVLLSNGKTLPTFDLFINKCIDQSDSVLTIK